VINTTFFIRIHFISLALALADLLLYMQWHISFRGQWADIILSFLPLLTAIGVNARFCRSLRRITRVYFDAFTLLNILCIPFYLVTSLPFPLETYGYAHGYELRQPGGILAPASAILIRKQLIFERTIASGLDFDPLAAGAADSSIKIVFKEDSVGVQLPAACW
jgi:hypothetical protein